jgi:hypothetical protein
MLFSPTRKGEEPDKVCLTLSFPSAPDEALLVGIIEAILANFSDASCFTNLL